VLLFAKSNMSRQPNLRENKSFRIDDSHSGHLKLYNL